MESDAIPWTSLADGPGVIVDAMARGSVRSITFYGRTIGTIRRLERARKGAPEAQVVRDGWTCTTVDFQRMGRELRTLMEDRVLVFRRFGTAEAVIEGVKP